MMAIHPCVQLWLIVGVVVLLSVVDRSCGMECNETLINDDFTSIVVKTYFNTDVEQIEVRGQPDEACNSAYIFSPHNLEILPEVMRMLLIHQRWHRRNKISAMINESVLSANYNVYKTIFEAKAGEWMLFSEPAFTGHSRTINPCYGKTTVPFTVKSIKPVSAKGIKQYRGEYFVSLMDFDMWMSTAYPNLPLTDNSMFMYLNQMLWFDLVTEIFRDGGGLIRISEDGGVFPDHPFNEPPPLGETTLFFTSQFPPLLPNEPPVIMFQSALNQFNFLGVRENPNGMLELISNSDGSEESQFFLETSGLGGFNLLKSRIFCVYVVVDESGPMPVFELIRDPDEAEIRGSFILI